MFVGMVRSLKGALLRWSPVGSVCVYGCGCGAGMSVFVHVFVCLYVCVCVCRCVWGCGGVCLCMFVYACVACVYVCLFHPAILTMPHLVFQNDYS